MHRPGFFTQSSLSWSRRAADRAAHPRVRGIARYVAIPRASGTLLRLPTANERKTAADPASTGRCENSSNRPPLAKARSLRAKPPPRRLLRLAAHAVEQRRMAPLSLHLRVLCLQPSHLGLAPTEPGQPICPPVYFLNIAPGCGTLFRTSTKGKPK